MRKLEPYLTLCACLVLALAISCSHSSPGVEEEHNHEEHNHGDHEEVILLSPVQARALGIETDTLLRRVVRGTVRLNGTAKLPPQKQARVSAIRGGYVDEILVIEGDRVQKGQALCYLKHPDFPELQTELLTARAQLTFLQSESKRLDTLTQRQIAARREYEAVLAEKASLEARVSNAEAQLELIGIDPNKVTPSALQKRVAIRAPLTGVVGHIEVQLGQYVAPEEALFSILNTDHIHVDLQAFARDAASVREGLSVRLTSPGLVQGEVIGDVFAVGKALENDPPRLRVHVRVPADAGLMAGAFVQGEILQTGGSLSLAVPEEGIAKDADQAYIFQWLIQDGLGGEFAPVKVRKGLSSGGFVEIEPLEDYDSSALYVSKGAYYLLAEWKNDEVGHGHSH